MLVTSFGNRSAFMAALATCIVFEWVLVENRANTSILEITGSGAQRLFANEAGGHRWQRVPPTERSGRRHTSTITVAVLSVPRELDVKIPDNEIEWQATRGSGKGGQARNKTSNTVRMRHIPTGLSVRIENERSQHQNRQTALHVLTAQLAGLKETSQQDTVSHNRRRQVGTGMRGDKRRTIRTQDNSVIDHITGASTSVVRYRAGHIEDLA